MSGSPNPSTKLNSFPEFISPMSPVQFNRINSHFPPLNPNKSYRGVYERCGFDVYKAPASASSSPNIDKFHNDNKKFNKPPTLKQLSKRPSLPDMNENQSYAPPNPHNHTLRNKHSNSSLTSLQNGMISPKSPSSVGSQSSRSSLRSAFFKPFRKNTGNQSSGIDNSSSHASISTAGTAPSIGGKLNQKIPLSAGNSPLANDFQKPFPSNGSSPSLNYPQSPSSVESFPRNHLAQNPNQKPKGLGIAKNGVPVNSVINGNSINMNSSKFTADNNGTFDNNSPGPRNTMAAPAPPSTSSSATATPGSPRFNKSHGISNSPRIGGPGLGPAPNSPRFGGLSVNGNVVTAPSSPGLNSDKKSSSIVYNGYFNKHINSVIASPNLNKANSSSEELFNADDGMAPHDSNHETVSSSSTNIAFGYGGENNHATDYQDGFLNDIKRHFSNSSDSSDDGFETRSEISVAEKNSNEETSDEITETAATSANNSEKSHNSLGSHGNENHGNENEVLVTTNDAKNKPSYLDSDDGDDDDSLFGDIRRNNTTKSNNSIVNAYEEFDTSKAPELPKISIAPNSEYDERYHISSNSTVAFKDYATDDDDKRYISSNKTVAFKDDVAGEDDDMKTAAEKNQAKLMRKLTTKLNRISGQFGLNLENSTKNKHNSVASSIYSVDDLEHSPTEEPSGKQLEENIFDKENLYNSPIPEDVKSSDSEHSDEDLLDDIKSMKSATPSVYLPQGLPGHEFNSSSAPALPTITVTEQHGSPDAPKGDETSLAKSLFRDLQKKTSVTTTNSSSSGSTIQSDSMTSSGQQGGFTSYEQYNTPIPAGFSANTTAPLNSRTGSFSSISHNNMGSASITANTSMTSLGNGNIGLMKSRSQISVASELSDSHFSTVDTKAANNTNNGGKHSDGLQGFINSSHGSFGSEGGILVPGNPGSGANSDISRSNTLDSINSTGSDDSILRKIVNMEERVDVSAHSHGSHEDYTRDTFDMMAEEDVSEKPLNVGSNPNLNVTSDAISSCSTVSGANSINSISNSTIDFQNKDVPIANRIQMGRVELKDISELNKSNRNLNEHQHDTPALTHQNHDNGSSVSVSNTISSTHNTSVDQSNQSLVVSPQQVMHKTPQQQHQHVFSDNIGPQKISSDEKFPPDYELPSPSSIVSHVSDDPDMKRTSAVTMEDDYPRYPSGEGPCRKCGLDITGKSIWSKDHQMSGRWHRACFSCYRCEKVFNKGTTCYVINDKPYCYYDFHFLNHSLCKICDDGIEGKCLENNNGERFHPDCLKCVKCGVFIMKDYFVLDGKPLCEKDGLHEIEVEQANMQNDRLQYGSNGEGADNGELKVTSKVEKRRTFLLELPETQPI
ncbi:Pxl1 protein [Saccharomycopsis crataegensis]|uniref:Pxl1 protein n=1 Tax=Saccharomycopsis crataegensis TaxID=43959 RepID=A0AAV5QUF9_9ASCO|nr:Pxl1 protein [Saccharomycopsis crataegensis]